ncbi:MAG: topoisomerase DNA-binding C4 zinc finger domain-containing protein [Candidatus Levybacteria bacterium]|nr:topoisomerase DNA-binding C4 zinc finger domain-containing protein [Candidatus Levybacteria bacterium]
MTDEIIEKCPKCQSPLSDVITTSTGRKLQRCSTSSWDAASRSNVGCDFVKWLEVEPEELDEKCPKCGAPLVLAVTRFGKRMKKCSTSSWDKEAKKAIGCDYVEWINGTTESLDEECPECGEKLVLFTTSSGKKMKKCSTSGWDRVAKKATGCTYVYWLKQHEYPGAQNTGEEFLPPEPEG